jgi:hypothetical protein
MSNVVYKRTLLICAVLFALVVSAVALIVIPAVESDVSPNAVPGKAAAAFWVNVGLNLLFAAAGASAAIWSKRQGSISVTILVVVAIGAFLLGLALVDAAMAFRSHESIGQGIPVLLLICAATDIVAGVVLFVAVKRRPRKGLEA